MLHSLLKRIDRIAPFTSASAHCDIPCGVYDPSTAQINALTVVRMTELILELEKKAEKDVADMARLVRLVNQKEEHAINVKDEIRVIWGDYYKAPQFEQLPGANELVHSIMMQASKCKQNVDRDMADELLNLVNTFAEGFWKTKGVETFKATCPYPPAKEVVYPKLG